MCIQLANILPGEPGETVLQPLNDEELARHAAVLAAEQAARMAQSSGGYIPSGTVSEQQAADLTVQRLSEVGHQQPPTPVTKT